MVKCICGRVLGQDVRSRSHGTAAQGSVRRLYNILPASYKNLESLPRTILLPSMVSPLGYRGERIASHQKGLRSKKNNDEHH